MLLTITHNEQLGTEAQNKSHVPFPIPGFHMQGYACMNAQHWHGYLAYSLIWSQLWPPTGSTTSSLVVLCLTVPTSQFRKFRGHEVCEMD